MGLDMYLYRMPRYKNATVKDVRAVDEYLNWKKEKENPNSKYKNCTMKKWCGIEYKDVKKEFIKYYKQFFKESYYVWDINKAYPHYSILEEVGYWRKANAIHNWFVEHLQDGEDDCNYHKEFTREDIESLLNTCIAVLRVSKTTKGKIKNGLKYINNEIYDKMEDGIVIENPEYAEKMLPSCAGFFFGGTDYDEYYLESIHDTIDICNNLLRTTDFETQMIYYCSSW